MAAPYKRGTKLQYVGAHHSHGRVTYVKWHGFLRGALITVRFVDGKKRVVHVDEVYPVVNLRSGKRYTETMDKATLNRLYSDYHAQIVLLARDLKEVKRSLNTIVHIREQLMLEAVHFEEELLEEGGDEVQNLIDVIPLLQMEVDDR